ncbi:tRNA pseudouridine(55) synthase TruB [Candidatus Clostridium radicumherbarum]|uniref:tRNA pseudouridine synthase B n=1 Tax=Candidatus Clostridium radicumherbarum TaxID=3381662 RepID=A0ABW8TT46_9CLOT
MDGIINIYKPLGVTSFDVVKNVMKLAKTKKVGHTGTLDPLATGVLPICIGRATKIVDYIMSENKVYIADLMLGIKTDTYDREGTILKESDVNLSKDKIIEVISTFVGSTLQEPPMYSAIKINGKRLYELARKGVVVERDKRPINIYDINILDVNLPLIRFKVTCSKGTYIRSLCNDIGDKLGIGGTMWNLERIQTGQFKKVNSHALEELNSENLESLLTPIDEALESYDKLIFSCKYENLLVNGVKINNPYIIDKIDFNKLFRVYLDDSKFIGLGKRDEFGFKVVKLLV